MDIFNQDKMPNILQTIKKRNLIKRYFYLTIALFISAMSFNLLLLPTRIVSGGTNGIAILTDYFFNISPSISIFFVSLVLLIFSFLFLGIEKTSASIYATIVYPFFVSFTANIADYIRIDTTDMILVSLFGGLISGITSGIMFKTGFSSGGLNIISQILYKYKHIAISKTNLVMNGIIVIIGGIYFGWNMVMYAIIVIYINSILIDRVLLGISRNKSFYIITKNDEAVKQYIIEKLKHSVTVFDVKGGFLEKKRKVLLAVVPTKEYFQLTEGIKLIDKEAFFVVSDAYQVEGGA